MGSSSTNWKTVWLWEVLWLKLIIKLTRGILRNLKYRSQHRPLQWLLIYRQYICGLATFIHRLYFFSNIKRLRPATQYTMEINQNDYFSECSWHHQVHIKFTHTACYLNFESKVSKEFCSEPTQLSNYLTSRPIKCAS